MDVSGERGGGDAYFFPDMRSLYVVADAHRSDGKRFVVRADEKLTAFVELESAIQACGEIVLTSRRDFVKPRRR